MSRAPIADCTSTGLDEISVETRTLLGLAIEARSLESLLPPGWAVDEPAQGPVAGANLFIMVADRLLVQDAGGQALEGQASDRLVVLAIPAAAPEAAGLVIVGGYSARPAAVPGFYQVFGSADIEFQRSLESHGSELSREIWRVEGADGCHLRVGLEFTRAPPARSQSTTWAYSAVDPAIRRLYVADQGADVLQSGGRASERLRSLKVDARGGHLAHLFDGTERVLSATSLPWSMRQAFVPMATRNLQ
jgi:hypothetical protein